jgi:putative two-component system response regulator
MKEKMAREIQVLIADDESLIRDILSRKLAGAGFTCTMVEDGVSALQKLDSQDFDLVMLDMNMPGKDGREVLKHLKIRHPEIAVIMVTAISDVNTAIELMKLGAFDYIIKPIDIKLLMLSIERALDKRWLLLDNKSYQLDLEEKVSQQTKQIRDSYLNSIKSLAYALEAKDEYTKGHSDRVTDIAMDIAIELGIDGGTVEKIRLAGLLHDIGKIGLREEVLNKPGRLTDAEFDHVKTHPDTGERILKPIIGDQEILLMVRHHHERYDGKGYPDGLSNGEIPQGSKILAVAEAFDTMTPANGKSKKAFPPGARILAIADAYDAMTSNRPYRHAMSLEAASDQLKKNSGTQFDPAIVDAFLRVLGKSDKYRVPVK